MDVSLLFPGFVTLVLPLLDLLKVCLVVFAAFVELMNHSSQCSGFADCCWRSLIILLKKCCIVPSAVTLLFAVVVFDVSIEYMIQRFSCSGSAVCCCGVCSSS